MNIPKEKYNEIIIALDGIRCDNRENRQSQDDPKGLRNIPDDIMQYIERKGYCKYIYGANCEFVRTLTEKGYDVLQYLDYSKYRKAKRWTNWKSWLPIVMSGIAIAVSIWGVIYKYNKDSNQKPKSRSTTKQEYSLRDSTQTAIHPYRLDTFYIGVDTVYK